MSEKDNTPENTPEVSQEVVDALTAKITENVQESFKAELENERSKTASLKESLDKLDARLQSTKKEAQEKETAALTAEEQIAKLTTRINEQMHANSQKERDTAVITALSGKNFTNSNASKIAMQHIINSLTKTESGAWVGDGNADIDTVVKQFVEDEENQFLFKQAESAGSGTAGKGGTSANEKEDPEKNKSLKDSDSKAALDGFIDGSRKVKGWGQ